MSYGFGPMSVLIVHVRNSGFTQVNNCQGHRESEAEPGRGLQSDHTHHALSHYTNTPVREPPDPWSHQSNTGHSVSSRVLLLRPVLNKRELSSELLHLPLSQLLQNKTLRLCSPRCHRSLKRVVAAAESQNFQAGRALEIKYYFFQKSPGFLTY